MSTTNGKLIQIKSGLWIREGTSDRYVQGTLREYKALPLKDEIVLDLGGHIGAFARMAIDGGAEYCVSYEPFIPNCDIWRKNLQNYERVKLVQAAVISGGLHGRPRSIQLYASSGDTMAHSIDPVRGRVPVLADAVTLEQVMKDIEPSVVKIDIEGAEYSLMYDMATLFPEYGVTHFACELHLNRKQQREMANRFVDVMDTRYEQIVPVKIGAKNWNTTGVWRLR